MTIAIVLVLVVVGQTEQIEAEASSLDALVIDFYPLPEGQLPLKKIMKHRIKVTNSGSKALHFEFSTELIGPFRQGIGTITPEPNFLWLDPGESEYILTKMDEKWGRIPAFKPSENNEIGNYERTYRWTFTDRSTKATRFEDVTIPYQIVETNRRVQEVSGTDPKGTDRGKGISGPVSFEGKVVNELGEPLSGMDVFLSTGHWNTSSPSTDSDGKFKFENLPSREDWILIAQTQISQKKALIGVNDASWQDTRQPRALKFVNEAANDLSLELRYPEAQGKYTLLKSKKPDVGYWRGDVDKSGSTILLINGMENWSTDYPQQEAKSLLSLFSIKGDPIWSYKMGWEGWGASLSHDGKYAAFTTSNCKGKANRSVPEGVCGKFGVLDATDGSEIWIKRAEEVTETTHNKLGSKEVEISNTNKFLAVGGTEGTLLLYDLNTGRLIWTIFMRGQIRGILFDEKDKYIYAGAGDGYTYKVSVSNGAVIWKTWNGTWPYLGAFKFSKQRDLLGIGGKYGDLAILDPETGERIWYKDMDDIVSWLDFSPDGKLLVAGGGGQYATTLFEARTGKKIWHLPYYSHSGMFTSDGKYILAGETLLDLSGREIGNFALSTTGCRPGCDGLFTYISDDLTKVVHTRRDMDPGGIGLYFWDGQLNPDASKVVKSADKLVDSMTQPNEKTKPDLISTTPAPPNGIASSSIQGFDSGDPKILECLQRAIGAERVEELQRGSGSSPDQQERFAMGPCYQMSQGAPVPVEPKGMGGSPSEKPQCRRLDENTPCFGSESPKLLECLQKAIGAERVEELRGGTGSPPDQRERFAMGPCYQVPQGAPVPVEPKGMGGSPSEKPQCRRLDENTPCFGSESPKLLECLQKVIGAERVEELRGGIGSPPDQRERFAMGPCYLSQSVLTPTWVAVRSATATSVPEPTLIPVPMATVVVAAPTAVPSQSPGGCNASINTNGDFDASWLVLGLSMPGLALRNIGRRKKSRKQ